MNNLNQYYETLGLKQGASPEKVREAYRDLAKVWHPDRFGSDQKLQQKAEEKLKGINEAYERLSQPEVSDVEVSAGREAELPTSGESQDSKVDPNKVDPNNDAVGVGYVVPTTSRRSKAWRVVVIFSLLLAPLAGVGLAHLTDGPPIVMNAAAFDIPVPPIPSAASSAVAGADCGSCWVHIFDDKYFKATDDNHIICGPGKYANLRNLPGAMKVSWGDEIESLKVGPTATVIVWTGENFTGASRTFGPGTEVSILKGTVNLSDTISSIEIVCP